MLLFRQMVMPHLVFVVVWGGHRVGVARFDLLVAYIEGDLKLPLVIGFVLFQYLFPLRASRGIIFYWFIDRFRNMKKTFSHFLFLVFVRLIYYTSTKLLKPIPK